MATRRGWDGRLLRKVDGLALDGWTAAEIVRELDGMERSESFTADRVPGIRTIERWVKAIQPKDPSGRWRLSVVDAEDAAFLLAVRAAVISGTEGRVRELTVTTVGWLRAIHAVAPDLEPWSAHRLARSYLSRIERERDTGDLDAWLAFGPWRGKEAAASYERAVREGWVDHSPSALNWPSRVVIAAGVAAEVSSDLSWVDVLAEDLPGDSWTP
jgi:hypothetical protein